MKHKLELRHNGETDRDESAWTARCICGRFEESCRLKANARKEYSLHWKLMRKVQKKREAQAKAEAQAPKYKCAQCKDTGLYDACCRPQRCDCEAGREKKFQEWAGFDGTGWDP